MPVLNRVLEKRYRVRLSTGVVVVIPARAVGLRNSLTWVTAPRKESYAPLVGGPGLALAGLENGQTADGQPMPAQCFPTKEKTSF